MKLYSFMALLINCCRYEMLKSVWFTCHATRRTANCVALAISDCAGSDTADANSELQRYTAELQYWLDRERLSQLALDRATLCISAVFPIARCLSVRPSICLSVSLARWCIVSRRLKISPYVSVSPVAPSF